MLVGGYTMDRLPIRQIHPLSIPGLVPMILGALLALCAVLLLFQAGDREESSPEMLMVGGSITRLVLTIVLTVGYGAIMVDRLPFFWATAIFITAFMLVFSWSAASDGRARAVVIAKSVGFGGIAAFGIVMLFQEAFLVRLP
ncbi:tripartite tricarboxylate transporter TctB family protein [Roseisalinus antarcticus]|nr:tripartite tricarboxylate transporter TctB family protein [Roseisalinus antarcticus]